MPDPEITQLEESSQNYHHSASYQYLKRLLTVEINLIAKHDYYELKFNFPEHQGSTKEISLRVKKPLEVQIDIEKNVDIPKGKDVPATIELRHLNKKMVDGMKIQFKPRSSRAKNYTDIIHLKTLFEKANLYKNLKSTEISK